MNHVLFHIILIRLLSIVSLLLLIYNALTTQWKSTILSIRNIDLLKNVQLYRFNISRDENFVLVILEGRILVIRVDNINIEGCS